MSAVDLFPQNIASERRPILVTGSHRSGTTWVGRVICSSPGVGYIQEPFNIYCRPGRSGARFPYWFQYVCDENERPYLHHIERTLQFRYRLWEEAWAVRHPRDLARMGRDFYLFQCHRIGHHRPLLRDPFAFFSAEWLAKRFSFDVLVLIRHPAAFVASVKSLRWNHPFDHFLKQPLLMRDHLGPFEAELHEFVSRRQGIVDQAILLWRLIHSVIISYQERHPEWTFARHRDLSSDPINEFRGIFERLHLPYTAREENITRRYCMAEEKKSGYVWNDVVRDSSQNMGRWRTLLTDEELDRIREKCYSIAQVFYKPEEMADIGLSSKL